MARQPVEHNLLVAQGAVPWLTQAISLEQVLFPSPPAVLLGLVCMLPQATQLGYCILSSCLPVCGNTNSVQDMLPMTPMMGTPTASVGPKQLPDPTPAKASRLGPMQQSGSSGSLINAWAPTAPGSPLQVALAGVWVHAEL